MVFLDLDPSILIISLTLFINYLFLQSNLTVRTKNHYCDCKQANAMKTIKVYLLSGIFIIISLMGYGVSPGINNSNINTKTNLKETIHYVIIGAFSYSGNAKKFLRITSNFEYNVNFGFRMENELYYVYLFSSSQVETARRERDKIRKKYNEDLVKNGFDSAWVLSSQPLLQVDKTAFVSRSELAEIQETINLKPTIETAPVEKPIALEKKEKTPPIVEQNPEPKVEKPVKLVNKKGVRLYPMIINTVSSVNGSLVNGTVEIIDVERAKKIKNWKVNQVDLLADPENGSGKILVSCDIFGYTKVYHSFSISDLQAEENNSIFELKGDTIHINFNLQRYEVGEIVTMYHVYFWPDATLMKPESKYELSQLLEMLQENEHLKVRVHGHTNGNKGGKIISRISGSDNLFSMGENTIDGGGSARKLSIMRGEIIVEYLVQNGIDTDRLDVIGWGGKKMVFDKKDPMAKLNIRSEIEILTN